MSCEAMIVKEKKATTILSESRSINNSSDELFDKLEILSRFLGVQSNIEDLSKAKQDKQDSGDIQEHLSISKDNLNDSLDLIEAISIELGCNLNSHLEKECGPKEIMKS